MRSLSSEIRSYMALLGSRGGRKSRRTLTTSEAKAMVKIREARRAYRLFHARCFWSYDPKLLIQLTDVGWVADQLRKHGGREAWLVAERLCR